MNRLRKLALLAALTALVAAPAVQIAPSASADFDARNASFTAGTHRYLLNPQQAPVEERDLFTALQQRARAAASAVTAAPSTPSTGAVQAAAGGIRFNRDILGLPQNEESVDVCQRDSRVVIGGTNDYRGIVDPGGNFTGWYFSGDGGRSVTNEGLLPPITVAGTALPSGGDPVYRTGSDCSLYASDLNYGGGAIGQTPSIVGLYRSTPQVLRSCPQGSGRDLVHPGCWPTRRAVAVAATGHFLDKEWFDVGRSGSAGEVVWIAYGDLSQFNAEGNEESGVIKAVRCDKALTSCTNPIEISTGQTVAEYPTVTITPDGRTVITWGEFFGGSFIGPTQRGWMAVAEPGSTTFTKRPVTDKRNQIIRGRETPHAADFRFGTMFPSTVKMVGGQPRVFVTWAECLTHALGQVCEEPRIFLTHSSDLGRTWSTPRVISAGGDNFMPNITVDPVTGAILAAWYTQRFDPVFHHRYDVELARLSDTGTVLSRSRVTRLSNDPDSDGVLTGFFIGDYFEVALLRGTAYVHFNANYRSVKLVGDGVPIPQQDNFLARVPLGGTTGGG
jgi:hypothetical protein